jgi:hypothetical protein
MVACVRCARSARNDRPVRTPVRTWRASPSVEFAPVGPRPRNVPTGAAEHPDNRNPAQLVRITGQAHRHDRLGLGINLGPDPLQRGDVGSRLVEAGQDLRH